MYSPAFRGVGSTTRQERRGMRRAAAAFGLALLVVLVAVPPAAAHKAGKAEPRIAAGISEEPGLERTLTVRLRDIDSGKPIRNAVVTAFAEMETHEMRTASTRVREVRPAIYEAALEFPEEGSWTVRIQVRGEKVWKASAKLPVEITEVAAEPGDEEAAGSGGHAPVSELPTLLEDDLTGGDYTRMASLWVHSVAAMGWIIGVLALVLGLSTRPGILAETARTRLGNWYVGWGALLHWGLVPVIVATGVYQMLYVTPFDLAYTPAQWDEVRDVPYGVLYEGILIFKLTMFGVLLVTGTMTLMRVIHLQLPVVPVSNPHPRFLRVIASVLGPAGIVYVLTVPLILGAAMALRYVHVLNHVAEVMSH
jgi:hypothetical protein